MDNSFWDYLKTKLTVTEFENLANLVGCPARRLAWIKNGSSDFSLDEIHKLGKLLNRNSLDLIMEYSLGEGNISFKELRQLAASQGYEIKLLAHAA